MIARFVRPLMMITDPLLYFSIAHVMVLYLFRKGVGQIFAFDTLFALILGVGMLAAITYHGAWGTIAERRSDRFLKDFVLFNIVPGVAGIVMAVIRSVYC